MARRFGRRRWRRPQRLTLEGAPPVRRKDVVAAEVMLLEPHLLWEDNQRRLARLLLAFFVVAFAEGLAVALAVDNALPIVLLPACAFVYLAAGRRFGDAWIQRALGARPSSDPQAQNLLEALARSARTARPELYVTAGEAPNGLALALGRRWICLTSGASALGRMELEALLAHELVHLRGGDAALAAAFVLIAGAPELALRALRAPGGVLALVSLPLWPVCLVLRATRRLHIPPDRELRADVAGALLTRYPPGMRRLLELLAGEHGPSALPVTDPFWTVPRSASAPTEARASLVAEM